MFFCPQSRAWEHSDRRRLQRQHQPCLCGAPPAWLSAAVGPRWRLAYAGALGVRLTGRLEGG